MQKIGAILVFCYLVTSTALSSAQVMGVREDFDDPLLTGWEAPNSATFALAAVNGTLQISYNRTAASYEWDNFNYTPPLIDVAAAPYITLKAKSTIACELVLKPVYVQGENWLPAPLPGDNQWHSYSFSLAPGVSSLLTRIYLYLDGGTTAVKSGAVWFDDLCIGDAAATALAPDGTALATALTAAAALHDNASEGMGEGAYPAGAKYALQTAIAAAQTVLYRSGATQVEFDQAEWNLLDACVTFESQANIPNPGLIDPLATPKTKYLYANLEQGSGRRLIFGMHDATGYGVGWKGDDDRSDVKSVCGDYPGLYGWDLNVVDRGSAPEMARYIYRIQSAYARGGINTLCWHQYDPQGRSFYGSVISDNVVATLLPGGTYHDFYKRRLQRIARFLKGLRGSDGYSIPIIFRPYHEHDGGAFWWGTSNCSAEEYNRLWRFTVTFLRDSLNVHNLIYAISPINFTTRNSYLKIYPGDSYVDIFGMDFYYWAPLDQRQSAFISALKVPALLAKERAKITALTEVGYSCIPEPAWFSRYLLPPFKEDSLCASICYAMVWRNESTSHFFAPYPGHASVPGFLDFYRDPYTAFEADLPPMYSRPGSDQTPPVFIVRPESTLVSTDTLITLYLETDERAHLAWGPADLPFAQLPGRFEIGQGGYKHFTAIHGRQGEEMTLYLRAIDISGNETPQSWRITIRVDTLQRSIPWYDERYPASGWSSGKAPLGYGTAAGNTTNTSEVKTLYCAASFTLPYPVNKLGLLLKCHDGALVRLNGRELLRYNLPAGEISEDTAALSGGKTSQIYTFTAEALALLRPGVNLLTIELHAAALNAADLSIDAQVFDASQIYFKLGSTWRYYDGGKPPLFTCGDYLSGIDAPRACTPQRPALAQNYPNPFNPETTIAFYLRQDGPVRLAVYDITGRMVAMLIDGRCAAGEHRVIFRGQGLASGVYLCRLETAAGREVRRMLLLR
ncbi:MAG TPA: glycosyl hydrolase [bacterium]|nr:glycosyl hydrolase [bacterium]HQI47032.1 glycosyl hydrolase [bacterium]HQJ65729.1 glycosyl hydrolase [bacterium]